MDKKPLNVCIDVSGSTMAHGGTPYFTRLFDLLTPLAEKHEMEIHLLSSDGGQVSKPFTLPEAWRLLVKGEKIMGAPHLGGGDYFFDTPRGKVPGTGQTLFLTDDTHMRPGFSKAVATTFPHSRKPHVIVALRTPSSTDRSSGIQPVMGAVVVGATEKMQILPVVAAIETALSGQARPVYSKTPMLGDQPIVVNAPPVGMDMSVLLNYDGTIFPVQLAKASVAEFLDGNLSWSELADPAARSPKPLVERMQIVDSEKHLREALDEDLAVSGIVYTGKLTPQGVYHLRLPLDAREALRQGRPLQKLVGDKAIEATFLGERMLDRDMSSEEARAQMGRMRAEVTRRPTLGPEL